MLEMCLMQMIGAGEISADPEKRRRAMIVKTVGAVSAFIVAILNMFISGLTAPVQSDHK